MSASSTTFPVCAAESPKLGAALEIVGYLMAVAAATLCFLMGWLTCKGAEVLTALLLVSLIGVAWKRFDGGRHPCFFFLCTLTVFQAGLLLAYCAGGASDILHVTLLTWYEFGVSPNVAALALLSIALSAICIYVPCRWNYRSFSPPGNSPFGRLLPYLYVLLWLSVPIQLFKNYRYYEYAKDHGGYLVLFLDHGGMAASVPLAVRAISLISLPAFVGIFVLEGRKKFLRTATGVYFLITAPVLLTGSRGAIFSLVLSLWYVAKVKSVKPARLYKMGLLGVGLVLAGALIGSSRNESGEFHALAGPSQFIAGQGSSLNVTEVAIGYRRRFAPCLPSYLAGELLSAFVAPDQANYTPGKHFNDDLAMFLNPTDFLLGHGTGSAYLAEAYLMGGLSGIVLVSGLLGVLLHGMHAHSRNPLQLFLVAMILPDVLWMARGGLLDWVSASVRVGISMLLLLLGWYLYQAMARIGCVLWRTANATDPSVQNFGI
jgi:oligosaccharide repeat unit polymerase